MEDFATNIFCLAGYVCAAGEILLIPTRVAIRVMRPSSLPPSFGRGRHRGIFMHDFTKKANCLAVSQKERKRESGGREGKRGERERRREVQSLLKMSGKNDVTLIITRTGRPRKKIQGDHIYALDSKTLKKDS